MKRWRAWGAVLALLGGLAGGAPASAQTLSYGVGAVDFGAPTAFSFTLFGPIAPVVGLVSYTVILQATLTDAAGDGISMSPVSPATSMFTFDVNGLPVFADTLGSIAASFGPLTYSGILDCGLTGCSSMGAGVAFLGSGGGDAYAITGSLALSKFTGTVPEPGTLALLALALAGLLVARHRGLKRA